MAVRARVNRSSKADRTPGGWKPPACRRFESQPHSLGQPAGVWTAPQWLRLPWLLPLRAPAHPHSQARQHGGCEHRHREEAAGVRSERRDAWSCRHLHLLQQMLLLLLLLLHLLLLLWQRQWRTPAWGCCAYSAAKPNAHSNMSAGSVREAEQAQRQCAQPGIICMLQSPDAAVGALLSDATCLQCDGGGSKHPAPRIKGENGSQTQAKASTVPYGPRVLWCQERIRCPACCVARLAYPCQERTC